MNRIGFPMSQWEEEYRIALLPKDVAKISQPNQLFFAKGYGKALGIPNQAYEGAGANIVSSRQAYKLEVLCQPKFCYKDVPYVRKNQILFGWLHLYRGRLTRKLAKKGVTAIAWERMYKGDHVFKRNNTLTGRIGVIHGITYAGIVPEGCKVAVIGKGNVGTGAFNQLVQLGVEEITVYHSKNISLLPDHLHEYDVIVHCSSAQEEILSKKELRRMKPGALLIDIGTAAIEGPGAQSIYDPTVLINRGMNLLYCVNHVPTLAYQTATKYISEDVAPYIEVLVKGEFDKVLNDATVIDKGRVLTDRLEER